ncbi:hypothetical protein EW146_g7118 [Bondarzewia mesenterica]|uniref:Uncharacterized protein n=1 Tax=Bondarzewia mesenterica TaxID=1095465 RepID=A0A4S4LNK4_9AGAM|nr:hypothetical protein EW146_g7118 [Bondarzewia mesenterica]
MQWKDVDVDELERLQVIECTQGVVPEYCSPLLALHHTDRPPMSNPYAPHLPPDILWLERATLLGDCMSQIAFGASFVIFLQTMYALYQNQNLKSNRSHLDYILPVYTFIIFALGTAFIGMDMKSLQLMFIDNREYPGGPTAYSLSKYSSAITVVPNACSIVAGWLADGFLLYRCLVIFHLKLYIIALPILMYLGSISMGMIFLFQISRPSANLWSETSVNFGIPYFSLSASLNVLLTLLIAARLLLYRRALRHALGPDHAYSIPYASIAAMIVESSMLYAVSSLLFIGPYGAKSHISNIFLPVLSQVQIIAPMLIIFRVATRRAWDSKTGTAPMTSIQFQSRDGVQHSTRDDADKETGVTQLRLPPQERDRDRRTEGKKQGTNISGLSDSLGMSLESGSWREEV